MQEKSEEKVEVTKEENDKNKELLSKLAQSACRIYLASFGGALVGLSLAHRHAGPALQKSKAVWGKTAQSQNAWGRAALSQDLPRKWAFSCAIFASIFESTVWMSPTSMITDNPYLQIIGNFTLGGTLAGAVYRGLPVQRNRGPGTIVAPRIGAGLVSGLILGFVPGVLVAGFSMLGDYIDAMDAVDEEDPEEAAVMVANATKKNEEPITLDAKEEKEPAVLATIAKKDHNAPITLEGKATNVDLKPIALEVSARKAVRNQ